MTVISNTTPYRKFPCVNFALFFFQSLKVCFCICCILPGVLEKHSLVKGHRFLDVKAIIFTSILFNSGQVQMYYKIYLTETGHGSKTAEERKLLLEAIKADLHPRPNFLIYLL